MVVRCIEKDETFKAVQVCKVMVFMWGGMLERRRAARVSDDMHQDNIE